MTLQAVSTSRLEAAARIASIEDALARVRPGQRDAGFLQSLRSARSLDLAPGLGSAATGHRADSALALGSAMALAMRQAPTAGDALRTTIQPPWSSGLGADYAELFNSAGLRHGVDPALLRAVAEVESGFDPTAVSSAGAQGLMQFMPATAREFGVDPFDPASAIDGAARYLAKELDRFGQPDLAIAAYNAGAGAVQRHGGIPPYAETQAYVQKVNAAWGRNR